MRLVPGKLYRVIRAAPFCEEPHTARKEALLCFLKGALFIMNMFSLLGYKRW
jgi:hypothetical protein